MDNPETLARHWVHTTIKNGQPRDTIIGYTRHRTKVRVNQRDNQEWTTQRHWQHWAHKTQDKW